MINEKLDRIQQDLTVAIDLMKDNNYLKNVEKQCDYVNEINEKVIKDKKELQDRIDKAIEYI